MADKYLLNCECGVSHPVGVHQAGAELPCECGRTVQVPRLGELKQLPREEEAPAPANVSSGWGAGQSLVLAGLFLGVLALAIGLWAHFSMPSVQQFRRELGEFSMGQLDQWLTQASPADMYVVWTQHFEQLCERGLTPQTNQQEETILADEAQQVILRNAAFALAAVGFGVAAVGVLLTWRLV